MSGDRQGRQRLARQLMEGYAAVTGLAADVAPHRYLWTDAFAVCNFLGLYRESGEGRYLDLALALVDQVHHVLGRHRPEDPRRGWISGLTESEGELHPTRGGLRIGKELPERLAGEPFDARLEWDRDGQYFHYLTQWMHALSRVSEETGMPVFRDWAIELAKVAHDRFVRRDLPAGPPRMAWKMSIDLSRPLVPSMGQHDPLDAWLAYLELETDAGGQVLSREKAEAASLALGIEWQTDDALGIGALLLGAYRLLRWMARSEAREEDLLERILAAARTSLDAYLPGDPLALPAERRLAFRELGLAIGLHALEGIAPSPALRSPSRAALAALAALSTRAALAWRIDEFWSDPAHRRSRTWTDHADINGVMLATSLAPEGYLGAPAPTSGKVHDPKDR